MTTLTRFAPVLAVLALVAAPLLPARAAATAPATQAGEPLKIFDGKKRILVLAGDSIMVECRKSLRRKIEKFMGGKDECPILFDPQQALPQEAADIPVIYLQQTRLYAGGSKVPKGPDDAENIKLYADKLEAQAKDVLSRKNVAMVVFGSPPCCPAWQLQTERLGCRAFADRRIPNAFYGPDPHPLTAEHYKVAVGPDLLHPTRVGGEIMAQLWFEWLLKYDGLDVPDWSRAEMDEAVKAGYERLKEPVKQWVVTVGCLKDNFGKTTGATQCAPAMHVQPESIMKSFARVFRLTGPAAAKTFPAACLAEEKAKGVWYVKGRLGKEPDTFEIIDISREQPKDFVRDVGDVGFEGGGPAWAGPLPPIPGPDEVRLPEPKH